ncbi:GNAT family N-acetyltransferase [Acinetobacter sp. SwsAc6]|uniref:GNAT family N-acetyltransferase n=1 Tax=Acinetobacter TaxID=469 RepID=UPI000D13406B|nr:MULTISPECIES: GNAT family N-acetyltransferase [Acinetobacter]NWK75424.1 GNAT family N-acetyltransferase [Acinetobacter sp. SwsAc6]QCO21995.1 GNAT family N-acetyltransferase [Acinetobacter cumulans]RKG47459.1 GNAT family N-acetyltransferase [Acinetobacter cumulans]
MNTFRRAESNDIQNLVVLINQAYRENLGRSWTNEQHIIQGQRIQSQQLESLLTDPHFELWVCEKSSDDLSKQHNVLLGCIGLTHDQDDVRQLEIGTFAVQPDYQNQGLGRQFLTFIEQHIHQRYSEVHTINMYVLNVRHSLIAFYERAGYQQSGNTEVYPTDLDVGIPAVEVHLIHLQKNLSE